MTRERNEGTGDILRNLVFPDNIFDEMSVMLELLRSILPASGGGWMPRSPGHEDVFGKCPPGRTLQFTIFHPSRVRHGRMKTQHDKHPHLCVVGNAHAEEDEGWWLIAQGY